MTNLTGPSAFNELVRGRKRLKQGEQIPPIVTAGSVLPAPALENAQPSLRKACRQVYEIKAQHTINNLAAYHKKKPHTVS